MRRTGHRHGVPAKDLPDTLVGSVRLNTLRRNPQRSEDPRYWPGDARPLIYRARFGS
jgi:hypothetical protein